MVTYNATYPLYAKLNIDGDKDLTVHVTAIVFRTYREPLYEVSWLANGDNKVAWIEELRLSKAEP